MSPWARAISARRWCSSARFLRPPPARLLDQAQELGARVVVAAAAGRALRPAPARAPRAAGTRRTAFSSTGTARSSEPRRAWISATSVRARDRERLVVAVVAALGQHARQRLPGLGLAVQVGQHRAQALRARRLAERALEAGDRAVALARRHVGAGQPRGDLAPRLAFGHRQAAVQPLGRRQRVARGERQPAQRVERLGARDRGGRCSATPSSPGRRPRARLRPGAPPPPTAPPTPSARRRPPGSGPGLRECPPAPPVDPWRRGRLPACATSDRVRGAHPGSRAGPPARCSAARAARRDERSRGAARGGAPDRGCDRARRPAGATASAKRPSVS